MRTTIRLDDALLKEAKRRALERDMSLTRLIEEALRIELHRPAKPREPITLPISGQAGGAAPGLDLNDNSAVLDWLDEHDG